MTASYEEIAALVSGIRNARFGEMVKYSEQLIDSGAWRDFTTPAGTRFQFRRCEYDYFLAAMEADATTLRHAYINKAPAEKLMRLADITGRGEKPANDDRRAREHVVREYVDDPSGAAARIREWAKEMVVTDRTAIVARDPERRRALETGRATNRERPNSKYWRVRWSDNRPTAEVIAEHLLKEPELACEVFKILRADHDKKRRSNGT